MRNNERVLRPQDDIVREFHGAKSRLEGRADALREDNLSVERLEQFEEAFAELRDVARALIISTRNRLHDGPRAPEEESQDEHVADVIPIRSRSSDK